MTARDDEQPPAPWDPAGTRPKHEPESLLPDTREPLLPPEAEVVDSHAIDEDEPGDLLPERRRAAALGDVAPAKQSAYAPRFQFLSGALVAVALAAIAGIAVLIVDSTRAPGPAWSAWKPTAGGVDGANEIADHVAPEYRESGQQLVKIVANDMSFKGVPLTVTLQSGTSGGIETHKEKGVLYQLCGLSAASNCAIALGKASMKRGLLMRRAALELALYSFRYLKDVKQVVVLMTPAKGRLQTTAQYFRRDEVRAELDKPLTASLSARTPSVSSVTRSPDARLVDRVTREPYLFTLNGSTFDNGGLLVLQPYSQAADDELQKELKAQQAAASGG